MLRDEILQKHYVERELGALIADRDCTNIKCKGCECASTVVGGLEDIIVAPDAPEPHGKEMVH